MADDIDYRIRPAKSVVRHMLCETAREMAHFGPLKTFQYIGFGSRFFSDFTLIHRRLGIEDMISIESKVSMEKRVRFNRPFNCIDPRFEHSGAVLPRLDLTKPTIVWLDYTSRLNGTVVSDLCTILSGLTSPSLVAVTVNVQDPGSSDEMDREFDRLKEKVGVSYLTPGLTGAQLEGDRYTLEIRNALSRLVESVIDDRSSNPVAPPEYLLRQVLSVSYSDSSTMLTVAWMVYPSENATDAGQCAFGEYSKSGEEVLPIRVPSLTPKEAKLLDSLIPKNDWAPLKDVGIEIDEAVAYRQIYRHYPAFVETELS